MKRYAAVIFVLILSIVSVDAQDKNPPFSFGVDLDVQYHLVTRELSIWNLRYGVGLDFLVHIGSSFYLGLEASALFGFHKASLNDPNFDRLDVQFPFRATVALFLSGFMAQIYGGVTYFGAANLHNGVLYARDFSFRLFPEVGAKIGFGDITCVFLNGGYVISDDGFFYFGIGVRLGL
jgi:hypothetical protein